MRRIQDILLNYSGILEFAAQKLLFTHKVPHMSIMLPLMDEHILKTPL